MIKVLNIIDALDCDIKLVDKYKLLRARPVWASFYALICPHSIKSGLVSFCIIFHNMYIMHYFIYLYIIRQFFEFSVIHL
uniref:Uncharacterized protein n=1 Tax=Siphoviridae sp. ctmqu18 TaxID=2825655 RepID=A0A8S5V670_9CAUD|nr:MAG TPA: hypothetical protein [Siphoviridae sp. ctmqu18]